MGKGAALESLNIAFYTDSFLPAVDGVVTSIKNTTRELEKRGHNVYIFAASNRTGKKAIEINGMNKSKVFLAYGVKFRKYPQYNIPIYPDFSPLRFNSLKIDLVHAHTPFFMGLAAIAVAKSNRLPIAGTFHTLLTDNTVLKEYTDIIFKELIKKYAWSYLRFFYNGCDLAIAPSESIKRVLQSKGIKNIGLVPNGIDMSRFNKKVDGSKVREKLLGNKYKDIVMYIGRTSKEKKLDVMLKAAKIARKDMLFVIGGTGPARAYYEAMARRYRLGNVKFIGFVKDEELPEYYAAADVFCIPSTFETQGIVSLEAMAVGKPVVGADKLALHELIENGKNGEKFAPGNYIECGKKIEKVINNINSYKDAVKTAKLYSIEKTTDKLVDIYKKLSQ